MIITRVSFAEDPWLDRMKENKLVEERKEVHRLWSSFFLASGFLPVLGVLLQVLNRQKLIYG